MPYQVLAVSDEVRQWNSQKGGPMNSYRVNLQDTAGNVTKNVEWAKKASSNPPQIGETVEGNIDLSGQYGPKFKQAFQQSSGGGARGLSPEERAKIQRQHSQEMAIRTVELALAAGLAKAETGADLFKMIFDTADLFDSDVNKARPAS